MPQRIILLLLIFPLVVFGQKQNAYSETRLKMDETDFHGKTKADTTLFTDGRIATIGHYAVDNSGRTSGYRCGLWVSYYHNGQVIAKGNYGMYSVLYGATKGQRKLEFSYKEGIWEYYYENGQLKAKGEYSVKLLPANTGVANQFKRVSEINSNWKLYNSDGSTAVDRERVIREIEHDPNCAQ